MSITSLHFRCKHAGKAHSIALEEPMPKKNYINVGVITIMAMVLLCIVQ